MLSVSSFAQQGKKKKKHPKQTNKKTPPKPTLDCLGHRPVVSQGSQGRLQTARPPAATATRPHPRRCLLQPCRLHHCHLQAFTHRVSRPTGGIRNSKCSKQFQHFQYTCWDFSMIHGQIKFSTSHTQTLVHFLFSASLYSVGPAQTATLKCSVQPCRGRTPRPSRYRG